MFGSTNSRETLLYGKGKKKKKPQTQSQPQQPPPPRIKSTKSKSKPTPQKQSQACFCTQCGNAGFVGDECMSCGTLLGKASYNGDDNINPPPPSSSSSSSKPMKKKNNNNPKNSRRITSISPLNQHPNQPIVIHGCGFGIKAGERVKVEWIGFREELITTGRIHDDSRIESRIPRKAVASQTYDVIIHTAIGTTSKFGYTLGA